MHAFRTQHVLAIVPLAAAYANVTPLVLRRWLMHWLAQHPSFQHSPRVTILTSLAAFGTRALEASLVGSKQVLYIPAPGDHLVSYGGKWIWVTRARASGAAQASAGR